MTIASATRFLAVSAIAWVTLFAAPRAVAQLRIVTYNTGTGQATGTQTARFGMDVILQAIGAEVVNGFAKPIDVLLLQEQFSMQVSTQSIVDVLNGIYGPGVYARSTLNGLTSHPEGEGGVPGLVYNTQSVQLVNEIRFGTVSGSAQPRSTLRYQVRPLGYDAAADLYLYNSHYKADDGSADQLRRDLEAQSIRSNSDALGDGANVIYAGDFNVYRSNEAMYQTLLAAGPGQAFDPISTPGSWHDSASFRSIHTQSPASSAQYPGQTPGGMDDRFDFQLMSGELLDAEGLSSISGSYHAFGNNGTHSLNGAITGGTGASPAVLNALMTVSDHLPVMADYRLPAKMGVQFGGFPLMAAMGAVVPVDVLVQNVASALTVDGVDELDYTISVTGDLLGGLSGTDFALGGGNMHQVMLNTATQGVKSGMITVLATSQATANPLFTLPVSFTVGEGNGPPPPTPMRMTIAKDDFDAPLNLAGYSQTPTPGAFPSSPGSGFQRYQVGVSATIPFDLIDDSNSSFPTDAHGIVVSASKTDGWFGIADTVNNDHVSGDVTATWQFDVGGAPSLEVSIDMGACGDFEAGADVFNWSYSIDGGAFLPLFTSSVDEAAEKTYTFASGTMATYQDPLVMTTTSNQAVAMSNVLQTLTSTVLGTGDVLTLRLDANANGGDEAYAFDNIVVTGIVFFAAADFDKNGVVDGDDLAAWRDGFGAATGATKAQGDADNDGDVDGADFLVWQRQLGQLPTGAALSGAVPEPAGVIHWLAVFASAGVAWRRRRATRGRAPRPRRG